MGIDSYSSEMQEIVDAAALPRTLMGNTAAMRDAGTKYLPRWPKETPNAWIARRDSSFLFNVYKGAHKSLVGRVFHAEVTLAKDVPDQFRQWAENIDPDGNHLQVFARNVFGDSLHTGLGHIIVNFPKNEASDGERKTKARDERLQLRPWAIYYPAENVLARSSTVVNGRRFWTMLRLLEETIEEDGDWGEKKVRRVRVLRQVPDGPVTYEVYRQDSEAKVNKVATGPDGRSAVTAQDVSLGDSWVQEDRGELSGIKRIPYVPYQPGFEPEPFLGALADKNLEHWQSASDQRNILHWARVYYFVHKGMKDNFKTTELHAGSVFHVGPDGDFEGKGYEGSGPGAGERDLERIEKQMQALAVEPLMEKPGGQTATTSRQDQERSNNALADASRALGDSLEQVFQLMAEWTGLGEGVTEAGLEQQGAGGSVIMPKVVSLAPTDPQLLKVLSDAAAVGNLSVESWLHAVKAAALEDLDIEEEMRRLEAGSLGLGDTGKLRTYARRVVELVEGGASLDEALDQADEGAVGVEVA